MSFYSSIWKDLMMYFGMLITQAFEENMAREETHLFESLNKEGRKEG